MESCPKPQRLTYTAHEIAAMLGVSIRQVYNLLALAQSDPENYFRVLRIGKAGLRVHAKSFDAWMDGQAE